MLQRIICKYAFTQAANKTASSVDAFKGLRKYVNDYQPHRAQKGLGDSIDFEKDMKPALEYYRSLGFSKKDLGFIFKSKITGLCLNNGSNNRLQQDIIQLSSFLKKEFNIDNNLIRRIVQKNHTLLSSTQEEIKRRFEGLKSVLNLDDKQTLDLVALYPQIFTSNAESKINKVKRDFTVWASFSNEQSNTIIQKHPYVVDFNQEYLHDDLKLLLTKGFKTDTLFTLISQNPDCLIEKPTHLEHSFHIPELLNLTQQQTIKTFIENPELITTCPISIIPLKIKMLKSFKVLNNNLKTLWVQHTDIFIHSIGSLDLKHKYLNQRAVNFTKPKDLISYYSLHYGSVIRPRCEAAIQFSKNIDLDVDLKISEEEFLVKHNIAKEEFEKVKKQYRITSEKDYKVRFYTQTIKSKPVV
ncbi:hypothetical protein ABPG72_003219 [Tetrahymena utriculariae]